MGEIRPRQLARGVKYIGSINEIDYYQYSEKYQDSTGTWQDVFPTYGCWIGSSQNMAAGMYYGAIQDLEAGDDRGLVQMQYFPKSWMSKDPSGQIIMVQSAPCPFPGQVNSYSFLIVHS